MGWKIEGGGNVQLEGRTFLPARWGGEEDKFIIERGGNVPLDGVGTLLTFMCTV